MVVSKLTLHGVESRELVVSDSLVLSASLGFLRRSGSKRGSACFGKIWRFPAPFPLDPSPGSERFAHKGPDGPAQPGMLEELIPIPLCRARIWRSQGRQVLCWSQKCPGSNASSLIRWLFSSFKQDFSTRIVMETTLGLFMDHKDYGGTNFAIFFRKSKNHGSAVCS